MGSFFLFVRSSLVFCSIVRSQNFRSFSIYFIRFLTPVLVSKIFSAFFKVRFNDPSFSSIVIFLLNWTELNWWYQYNKDEFLI